MKTKKNRIFFFSLTGLACSSVHCQYFTWNKQVERDQSSLFFSSSDWISSPVFGSYPVDLTAPKSPAPLVNEALWCRGRTFWNLSNSHCKYGYSTGNIIMPWGPYLFATELGVSWQERANLTAAELHNVTVVSFTISFLFYDCSIACM